MTDCSMVGGSPDFPHELCPEASLSCPLVDLDQLDGVTDAHLEVVCLLSVPCPDPRKDTAQHLLTLLQSLDKKFSDREYEFLFFPTTKFFWQICGNNITKRLEYKHFKFISNVKVWNWDTKFVHTIFALRSRILEKEVNNVLFWVRKNC